MFDSIYQQDTAPPAIRILEGGDEAAMESQALPMTQSAEAKKAFRMWKKVEWIQAALLDIIAELPETYDGKDNSQKKWADTSTIRIIIATNLAVTGLFGTDGATHGQVTNLTGKIGAVLFPKLQLILDQWSKATKA